MKTRTCILLALAALAVGCSKRPASPEFVTRSIDTLLGDGAPACRIEYRFASIDNAAASPALQNIEQANIGYFFELEEFTGSMREAAREAVRDIEQNLLRDTPEPRTYEVSVESHGAVVDTLLTYVIVRAEYLGGAHGVYGTECHNYSLADGYELCTADLFTLEQLQALEQAIHAKLLARFNATDDAGLSAAGLFPDYISITENFLVTPRGITFHYNPYEIGCYALGALEVEFSREELDALRR